MRSQAEPIAVIILTVVGLAIALLAWSWMNATLGPVSRQASLTEYLALERGRETATVISAGVDPATGYKEYIFEVMHLIVTERRWVAFTLVAYRTGGAAAGTLIDPNVTARLQQALADGQILVYALTPYGGSLAHNDTIVEKLAAQPDNVILYDGSSLLINGVNTTIVVVRMPEYVSGVGDPTPQAIVELLIPPNLVPEGTGVMVVTLTMADHTWYEVTRVTLPP